VWVRSSIKAWLARAGNEDVPFAAERLHAGSLGCGHWELQGFNHVAGAEIVLDPENPIIDVATAVASGLASRTGPAGTLTQTLTVSNRVTSALGRSDRRRTGPRSPHWRRVPRPLHQQCGVTENNAFNGVSDLGTLTARMCSRSGAAAS